MKTWIIQKIDAIFVGVAITVIAGILLFALQEKLFSKSAFEYEILASFKVNDIRALELFISNNTDVSLQNVTVEIDKNENVLQRNKEKVLFVDSKEAHLEWTEESLKINLGTLRKGEHKKMTLLSNQLEWWGFGYIDVQGINVTSEHMLAKENVSWHLRSFDYPTKLLLILLVVSFLCFFVMFLWALLNKHYIYRGKFEQEVLSYIGQKAKAD